MGNSTRTCAKCSASANDVQFKKDKRAHDDLGAYCLACQREYNAAHYGKNKAKLNAENNARYHANKDSVLEQQREYRAANIDRIKAYDRARYQADPEGRSAHVQSWIDANRERYLATKREYSITNRDRRLDIQTALRLDNAGFGADWEPIVRRDVWESYGRACGICRDPITFEDMTLDHIYPISKGGEHLLSNVQPAHWVCNLKKRDTIIT
ncbi:MAG TPA: hypothetical protein DCY59_02815 [Micrococcaceae bacterium]|nr:hypothetical protein [Micrococcaceae bacterium]